MYHVVGLDGKTYGPVSATEVEHWIADGRAFGHTQILPGGSNQWRPIASQPEFAIALAAAATMPPTAGGATGYPGYGGGYPGYPAYTDPAITAQASNKIAAGICGILLGALGVHKFILGYTGAGVVMLLITLLTCGFGAIVTSIIGIVEGIIYLSKTDADFVQTYVRGRREWF